MSHEVRPLISMNETEGIFGILNLLNLKAEKRPGCKKCTFWIILVATPRRKLQDSLACHRSKDLFFLHVPTKNLSDMNAQQGKYLRFSAGHAITPPGFDFLTILDQLEYASWHRAIRFPVNLFQIHILSAGPCILTQCCT